MRKMLPFDWGDGYPNVWLGTTAEDAIAYKQRVKHLLKIPAVIHFVSYEPALGPLGKSDIDGEFPDWLIIGGESGVRSDIIRHTDPQWVTDAIAECRRLSIASFLKQWGTYRNNPFVFESSYSGKQGMQLDPPENGKGGAELDGRLWREFPNDNKVSVRAPAKERRADNGSARRPLFA